MLEPTVGMEGKQRRLPGAGKAKTLPGVLPGQLALPFGGEAPKAGRNAAPRPRAEIRREAPGRRLRVGSGRALEEVRLEQSLAGHIPSGKALNLKLTDNRYSMVAVRRAPVGYRVRVHRMFAGATPHLVRALARYVVHNDRRASVVLGDYIEKNKHIIRQQPRRPRKLTVRTAGRFHDLQAIYDRLNAEYFAGQMKAQITWGPAVKRRGRQRSIKMGSFSVEDRVIRIHPALDQPGVPGYFVAWIVFHEMLHGKYEVIRVGGRRCFHPKEFLEEERTFAEYHRACAWERANIDRLLGG